jgi:hypothetical protein
MWRCPRRAPPRPLSGVSSSPRVASSSSTDTDRMHVVASCSTLLAERVKPPSRAANSPSGVVISPSGGVTSPFGSANSPSGGVNSTSSMLLWGPLAPAPPHPPLSCLLSRAFASTSSFSSASVGESSPTDGESTPLDDEFTPPDCELTPLDGESTLSGTLGDEKSPAPDRSGAGGFIPTEGKIIPREGEFIPQEDESIPPEGEFTLSGAAGELRSINSIAGVRCSPFGVSKHEIDRKSLSSPSGVGVGVA